MRRYTFSDSGFEEFLKNTHKQYLLEEMATIISWQELTAAIVPFYPNPEEAGKLEQSADNAHTWRGHHIGTSSMVAAVKKEGGLILSRNRPASNHPSC